jgi:hypothetical protein
MRHPENFGKDSPGNMTSCDLHPVQEAETSEERKTDGFQATF